MASTAKPSSLVDRVGRRVREEAGVVEIDAAFGRMLGFADGQKVRIPWQSWRENRQKSLRKRCRSSYCYIWTRPWRIPFILSH